MEIRSERAGDEQGISSLVTAAFATAEHSDGTEAAIVEQLRQTGALTVSLVVEDQGTIIGHVAFSAVTIGGQDCGWFGLGPVAVEPECQGAGIGARLIRQGLEQLRAAGAKGCVVLGEPDYYGRFGFRADSRLTYPGPPPQYFQMLPFGADVPTGTVTYHPAFG